MKYFIGFLVTIGLIIILILLLFRGGNGTKVPTTKKTLNSYASTDAQVRVTIDGPVNAQSIHQQVQITVGQDNVTYNQIQGYDGNIVNSQNYANTQNAYSAFLHSLTHASFTKGSKDPLLSDYQGYCPLGNRYIFELMQSGKILQRYWSTSCGKPKTYLGDTNLTLTLFQAQVPNYSTLTQNLSL